MKTSRLTLALSLLASALSPAARADELRWVDATALEVTAGEIVRTASNYFTTVDPRMRAVEHVAFGEGLARTAKLRFRYRGESRITVPLASGSVRRQIGLKLLARDPCNLIYVMWRFWPEEQIVVLKKQNPGLDESTECENRGYESLGTVALEDAGLLTGRDHSMHRLEAQVTTDAEGDRRISVFADGVPVWSGEVPEVFAGIDGPVGLRSDNGSFIFTFWSGDRDPD